MKPGRIIDLYLWASAAIYLFAFSSLYYQIPGLYGDSGVTPVQLQLPKCDDKQLVKCALYGDKPTILHVFVAYLGLSPVQALEFACLLGVALSTLAILLRCARDFLIFTPLWYLYFSCFQVGSTFLWFQWDTLLIEAGFLTALLAPCRLLRFGNGRWLPHDNVGMFMVRWLAFRLMFASGVVKLTSECQTWWGLTALNFHYESQCLPTALSWFAHHLPDWVLSLSVVITYVIEMALPIWFLLPVAHLRRVAFYAQVVLMGLIMATGNYNWFNLSYLAVCLPMLVEMRHSVVSTDRMARRTVGNILTGLVKFTLILVTYGVTAYCTIKLFSLKININEKDPLKSTIGSKIAFEKDEFYEFLNTAVPTLMTLGVYLFVMEFLAALMRSITDSKGVFRQIYSLIATFAMCSVYAVLFAISLVPFKGGIIPKAPDSILWPELYKWHEMTDKYQLTHSYGLFRSLVYVLHGMTGVGGRPELIMEGANDLEGPWLPYEFTYKPGALDKTPPFNMPHQPRLDWQMWFAALGNYQRNPWYLSLVHRLLINEPNVVRLLESTPFGDQPPTYIRSTVYKYHYTKRGSTDYWRRDEPIEYLPTVSLDNSNFMSALEDQKLTPRKPVKTTPVYPPVVVVLQSIRQQTDQFKGHSFVWTVSGTVLIMRLITKRILR